MCDKKITGRENPLLFESVILQQLKPSPAEIASIMALLGSKISIDGGRFDGLPANDEYGLWQKAA